jgi:hypothetical protein
LATPKFNPRALRFLGLNEIAQLIVLQALRSKHLVGFPSRYAKA